MTNDTSTAYSGLLPVWARYCGWLFLIGQTLFISRIIYESTFLTCWEGPQMVGFALAHGAHNFFLLGLPFVPLGALFSLGMLVFGAAKGFRFNPREWGLLSGLVATLFLLFVPYEAWEHLDVAVCSAGPLGDSYLLDAARTGNLEVAKNLIAQGHNVNRHSGPGETPLLSAAEGGQLEVARFLIAKGADVNGRDSFGETPLMEAASSGNTEMVKLLLAQGADPCAIRRDWEQENAQLIAEKKHKKDAAEYLAAHSHCSLPPLPPTSCANESAASCVEVH